ncbi:MAG: hypothetical protein QM705_15000 [Ancrocorticia sp.]
MVTKSSHSLAEVSEEAPPSDVVTQRVAQASVFLTALRYTVAVPIPFGVLVGVACAPMWLASLRRYRGAVLLAVMIVSSVIWGVILTYQQAPFNGGTDSRVMMTFSLLIIFTLVGFGTILWAREHLSERAIGIAVGLGMLATNILNKSAISSVNPWKFGISLPLSVIILAYVAGSRRWQTTVIALLALGAVNVLFDSRSAFATCVLAALLMLAQRWWGRADASTVRSRAISLFLVAVTSAAVLYQVTSHLLMSGFLGEEAQQRSIAQQELAGSMIVGGRPEMAATWALMQHRPAGFGSGANASTLDVMVAKAGMWKINYQPDNGYVERYMFGRGIELHSAIGDMWAYYGLVGLACGILIVILIAHALFVRLATGTASGLIIFLSCTTLWNLLFGPLWETSRMLAVILGLILLRRDITTSARAIITKRIIRDKTSTSTSTSTR